MAGISVKIDGMAKTRALLKGIAATEDEAAKELVRKAAADIQDAAMHLVPVKSGTLKRSIMIDIFPGGQSAKVEATADYAAYVEYGTRYMSARPFMTPAAQIVQTELNGGEAAETALKRLEDAKGRNQP